jgi:4'-phosphopantetheinyl transferase EntD
MDGLCPLFPEEEQLLRPAVLKRRLEFSTGRCCAREALAELRVPPAPILMGPLREPVWPAGILGTITHTDDISAAVVVRTGPWKGIGIDLLDRGRAGDVLRDAIGIIADEGEEVIAQEIAGTRPDGRVLLFSAKESVIKAVSSSFQRFVDFTEINVVLDRDKFSAACPGIASPVLGWWKLIQNLLVTGAVFEA